VLEVPVPVPQTAGRQIRQPIVEGMGPAPHGAKQSEVVPRKASKLQSNATVPQTDTGGRDEYSKALERTREKELGKLVP
jgi:hypothetical protein